MSHHKSKQSRASDAPEHQSSNAKAKADHYDIEVHLKDLNELFDMLDPSPFRERDLSNDASAYIFDSVTELPRRAPHSLVIHLEQKAPSSQEGRDIGDAIRVHFARQAKLRWLRLRQLVRRGLLSLAIGLTVLAAFFTGGHFIGRWMGEGTLLREGMLIGGWVAMWRPLEIFLYDWWPIVGERRIYDRLSRLNVRVVYRSEPQ